MGLFDFIFKGNKSEEMDTKSKTNSPPKETYTHTKATIENWHDAVGISISDEFEATVYERRGYGIMVSFMHNGKEYRGLVHAVGKRVAHPAHRGVHADEVVAREAVVGIGEVTAQVVADEVLVHLVGVLLLGKRLVLHLHKERAGAVVVATKLLGRSLVARAVGLLEVCRATRDEQG